MNTVTIEKVVFGGFGLSRTSNGVVFIPGVLPGEIVEISHPIKNRGTLFADVTSIVNASGSRRKPNCPYFGVCGGCDWLHISYGEQIQIKKDIYKENFRKIAENTLFPEPEVFNSPETGYRMRARLQVDDQGRAGFYKRSSNDIVALSSCPLLTERLNGIFATKLPRFKNGKKSEISVIDGDNLVASEPVIQDLTSACTDITVDGKVFSVNGGDFFQSNRFVNQSLGTWFRPFVEGDFCIDLYGGSGFFSMMVASRFKEGLLIESVKSQVDNAKTNFKNNGISHFKALCIESEELLSTCNRKPDCIITDPPRHGLTREVRSAIAELKPKTVVYVSCNISTQARDCAFFVKEMNYSISKTALFECYPNTSHIESVIILKDKT
jgi:23S rRNA (uracil1939-C5)-methyltransferase